MSTTRKKQIFKAMKFRTIKIAKFYSSEIKWVYNNNICLPFFLACSSVLPISTEQSV